MKVVDCGVVVEILIGHLDPHGLGAEELAAPHLLDSEVLHVLRRLVRGGALTEADGRAAATGFPRLGIRRFPADGLQERIWDLRHNLTAYDATYVAVAERIGASALLTTDARLAAAPGTNCRIELLP